MNEIKSLQAIKSEVNSLTSKEADEVRFELTVPSGFNVNQVDNYIEDVVKSIEYYEEVISKLIEYIEYIEGE